MLSRRAARWRTAQALIEGGRTMAIRCQNCGHENPDDYAYCDNCGARLEPGTAGAAAPMETMVGGESGVSAMPSLMPPGGEPGLGSGVRPDDQMMGEPAGPGPIRCPNCGAENMPGAA